MAIRRSIIALAVAVWSLMTGPFRSSTKFLADVHCARGRWRGRGWRLGAGTIVVLRLCPAQAARSGAFAIYNFGIVAVITIPGEAEPADLPFCRTLAVLWRRRTYRLLLFF